MSIFSRTRRRRCAYRTLLIVAWVGGESSRVKSMNECIPVMAAGDVDFVREVPRRGLRLYGFRARTAECGPMGLAIANKAERPLRLEPMITL